MRPSPTRKLKLSLIPSPKYFASGRWQATIRKYPACLPSMTIFFIFYARGVLETVKKLRWCPDIIHCHGWMTALAPLYIKKAYKDEPSFRDAKVVFSVFEDDFKESFNADFVNRLVLKGVTKKDVAHLKAPVDYATLCKLAIDYADGIIQQSEKVNEEVMEYARQSGKLILEYQTPETFADACNEFYDRVWETEQK